MTVPLDIRNDIRPMDADGVSRSEIARRLHVSRNTVSKYADMEDMSPVAPVRRAGERPGLEGNGPWIEKVLDEDLSAPRKQRHTAKRIYDRLVEERGFTGSYSTVRRFVAEFRRERSSGAGEGFLELEWAPGYPSSPPAVKVDIDTFYCRASVARTSQPSAPQTAPLGVIVGQAQDLSVDNRGNLAQVVGKVNANLALRAR